MAQQAHGREHSHFRAVASETGDWIGKQKCAIWFFKREKELAVRDCWYVKIKLC